MSYEKLAKKYEQLSPDNRKSVHKYIDFLIERQYYKERASLPGKSKREEYCLQALKEILKYEFPEGRYCLGDYKDDAVCMKMQKDGKWLVFDCFKGKELALAQYNTVLEAAYDMIGRLSPVDKRVQTTDRYLNLIIHPEDTEDDPRR